MKSTDNVGITFANLVLGRGIMNGVVNVTLGAYEFNPDGDKVEPSPAIVSRLRMDVVGATALRDALTELLQKTVAIPAPAPSPGVAEKSNGIDTADGAAKH